MYTLGPRPLRVWNEGGRLFSLALLVNLIGAMFVTPNWRAEAFIDLTRNPADATTSVSASAIEALDDMTLTIRESGFEPSEVTRPAGKFLLSVDNKSGVAQITLRLSRVGSGHVRDIVVPKDATDWAEELDLQPGMYDLTELNHPNWNCRITVN